MKNELHRPALRIFLVAMVCLHAYLFWNVRDAIRKGYGDFAIYYCAGTILRAGMGHHLYDTATQFAVQQQFAPEVPVRKGPLPYTHPAFEGLIFAPFTYLSFGKAFVLWDGFNLVMLLALPFLLRRYLLNLQESSAPFWMLAFLAFFPIFFALLQGQDAIPLLFLYALAFVALKKNRDAAAGGCLALGLYKYHLVLPFLAFLLLQKRRRVLRGFVPVALALVLVSVALVGFRESLQYPVYVWRLEETMAAGAIVPGDMVTLRGLLSLFLAPGTVAKLAVAVVSLVLFCFAAWRGRDGHTQGLCDLRFSLFAVATVLVSYHAMGYDLSMLMLPVLLLTNHLSGRESVNRPGKLIAVAVAILFVSPFPLLLLMRSVHLAYFTFVLLLLFCGIASELANRRSQPI